MNIKKSIKIGMAQRGINHQTDLSELSGVNVVTISNIMSGNGNPSVASIEKIASAMEFSVSEFYALGEE